MCGYLGNVIDDPLLKILDLLEAPGLADVVRNIVGAGPASSIDIITHRGGELRVDRATWWLLLEPVPGGGFKPSKFTSFNTRADKLHTPRGGGYHAYRHSRCILPATYIVEGEGPKGARRYHRIQQTQHQFALGGLHREWVDKSSGEITRSCSLITLPPHPAWHEIHSKSTPLFLPPEPALLHRWLSPEVTDVAEFEPLLQPAFPEPLRCVPVERPSRQVPVGEEFTLPASE